MTEFAQSFRPEKVKDNLETTRFLFDSQREFSSKFMPVDSFVKYDDVLTENPRNDPRFIWSLDAINCIVNESSEIVYTMPWKHWKDNSNWYAKHDEIKEEVIDVLHFVVNLGITLGLTPEDVGPIEEYFQYEKIKLDNEFNQLSYIVDDHLRAQLTLKNIEKLQNKLILFRMNLPWDSEADYSGWKPNYDEFIPKYREVMSLFARQSLIWNMDETTLLDEYIRKHEINNIRIMNGRIYDPLKKFGT